MKVYCDCGAEMKTGKEYDAKKCTLCLKADEVKKISNLKPVVRKAQDNCPLCFIARTFGTVSYCACMIAT